MASSAVIASRPTTPWRWSCATWAEAVRSSTRDLDESYQLALQEYLTKGGEAPLLQAYELGRQALDSGIGLLGLVNIHQSAVSDLLKKANGRALEQLNNSHHFLLE